jgi:Holliday junction resolvase RusA-like endonuclease
VPESTPFAIALAVKPISSNAKPAQSRWYDRVLQDAARAQGGYLLSGPLYARIVWFRARREQDDIDADNIPKRILDALKQIVFENDDEIVRCLAIKTIADAVGRFDIDPVQVPSFEVLAALQGMLLTERNVLYIEIGPATDPRIVFGPVR